MQILISLCNVTNQRERDCLTRWIWLLMIRLASSRPKLGTGPFFRCSNDFISQKVYFLRLVRVYVGLIMLAAFT